MTHVELHLCMTLEDSALLEHGGLPRYDLEPSTCDHCNTAIGLVEGQSDSRFWRPVAVVVWDGGISALCHRCVNPIINTVRRNDSTAR